MRHCRFTFASICVLLLCTSTGWGSPVDELQKKQQEMLGDQKRQEFLDDKRRILKESLHATVAPSLERVYDFLKVRGIVFKDVTPFLARLNFAFRVSGGDPMVITRSKDNSLFVVSRDWGRDVPMIVPAGIDKLVRLVAYTQDADVDSEGHMAKKCFVTLKWEYLGEGSGSGNRLGRYSCGDVLSGTHQGALNDAFAGWLLTMLSPTVKKH